MFLKQNILKFRKVLQTFYIAAIALVCALIINTLQTHVSDLDQGELDAFLGKTIPPHMNR